jgi:hypothetical protein
MSFIRVDALSECLRNKPWPNLPPYTPSPEIAQGRRSDWGDQKVQAMKMYKIHFAFENQREKGYITEKLWYALESGTLPVYMGDPSIKENVPNNSVVVFDDFSSVEALGAHLKYLLSNHTAYMEYHAWRFKPLPDWWLARYKPLEVEMRCRMCRWAYAKTHDLPWNQKIQHFILPPAPTPTLAPTQSPQTSMVTVTSVVDSLESVTVEPESDFSKPDMETDRRALLIICILLIGVVLWVVTQRRTTQAVELQKY